MHAALIQVFQQASDRFEAPLIVGRQFAVSIPDSGSMLDLDETPVALDQVARRQHLRAGTVRGRAKTPASRRDAIE